MNRVKKTIVCKDIDNYRIDASLNKSYLPSAGDVAIFEIIEIGKHNVLQCETKRNQAIFVGDHILAAFGNRYATDQFEGYIPKKLTGVLDILAIGGVVGIVESKHEDYKFIPPTKARLLGYAIDTKGKVINSKNYTTDRIAFTGYIPDKAQVILSVGSTMGSGKTTSAAFISRAITNAGKKVAYIKLTGTAYTKDKDFVYDCGAIITVDFTEVGYPSTYLCDKEEILDLYQTLLNLLTPHNPDYIIVELADGLVQRETDFLLNSKEFTETIDHVVFSGNDSLGVFYGIEYLNKIEITPVAISGLFTMSPLLIEEVKAKTNIPVITTDDLIEGKFADLFLSANPNYKFTRS